MHFCFHPRFGVREGNVASSCHKSESRGLFQPHQLSSLGQIGQETTFDSFIYECNMVSSSFQLQIDVLCLQWPNSRRRGRLFRKSHTSIIAFPCPIFVIVERLTIVLGSVLQTNQEAIHQKRLYTCTLTGVIETISRSNVLGLSLEISGRSKEY